jgi:hypothetical protein
VILKRKRGLNTLFPYPVNINSIDKIIVGVSFLTPPSLSLKEGGKGDRYLLPTHSNNLLEDLTPVIIHTITLYNIYAK